MNPETSTNHGDQPTQTYRFGHARFGTGTHSALTLAALLGIAVAVIAGVLVALTGSFEMASVWVFAIFTVCLAPGCVALVWIVVVDRNSIPGAIRTPEYSVETTWLDKASQTTCLITFPAVGIGAALTSNVPEVSLTLIAVCGLMVLTFVAAYLWEKRRS
ncbi:MAG: hypothetical protein L0K34_07480 [Ancrocorticia sp.]|nr:hypothetical protein [Ancrocorticia sp.]